MGFAMLEQMDLLIAQYALLPRGKRVLCAVSGGADSVCLLHRLYRLRFTLGIEVCAAHYNHQLRGEESDRDEVFTRQFVSLCCGRDLCPTPGGGRVELPPVELVVGRGDVRSEARRQGKGLEETAREMRYAFLRQTARALGAHCIATAHNADDNAETVLLHLLRGAGARGMGGIAVVRGDLIRPLLTCSREEIEAYLRFYGLPHVEDSSNASDDYLRNRLRHHVLPALEEACPGARLRIGRSAAFLREDEAYLESQAHARLGELWEQPGRLEIPAGAVGDAPDPVAVRCVRELVGHLVHGNDNCTAAHLQAVVALSRSREPGARTSLPGGLRVRREYEKLIFERSVRDQAAPLPVPLKMSGETRFGAYQVLCQPETYQGQRQGRDAFYLSRVTAGTLTLRTRQIGDELRIPGRRKKTLKKWMIDEKIPKLIRDRLPVLDAGGQVAAAALLGADERFLPRQGEPCWHITVHSRASQRHTERTEWNVSMG